MTPRTKSDRGDAVPVFTVLQKTNAISENAAVTGAVARNRAKVAFTQAGWRATNLSRLK